MNKKTDAFDRQAIQQRLIELQATITQQAGSAKVHLIAVSKTFPPEAIMALYQAGQRDFGENYVQEWQDKALSLPKDIIWHLIGDIQSNKTRPVAENAAWVHSLSRERIAKRLNDQRPEHLPPLNICLEINISQSPQKHGIAAAQMLNLANYVNQLPHLKLRGIMCIPNATDMARIHQEMQQTQTLFLQLKNTYPTVDTLSMGMSNDWPLALQYGATHLRIGRALFGSRTKHTD